MRKRKYPCVGKVVNTKEKRASLLDCEFLKRGELLSDIVRSARLYSLVAPEPGLLREETDKNQVHIDL